MYGYIGSMRACPGQRDALVEILLRSVEGPPAAGCLAYTVAAAADDPDVVWVTEVWESAEAHHASLRLPATRAAIEEARPLLTGEFTRQETEVRGGTGLR